MAIGTIMRAFVEIRKIVLRQTDLPTGQEGLIEQLKEIKERLGEHDYIAFETTVHLTFKCLVCHRIRLSVSLEYTVSVK